METKPFFDIALTIHSHSPEAMYGDLVIGMIVDPKAYTMEKHDKIIKELKEVMERNLEVK